MPSGGGRHKPFRHLVTAPSFCPQPTAALQNGPLPPLDSCKPAGNICHQNTGHFSGTPSPPTGPAVFRGTAGVRGGLGEVHGLVMLSQMVS